MNAKAKTPGGVGGVGGVLSSQELLAQVKAKGGGLPEPEVEAPLPWLYAHPKLKHNFTLRLPDAMHMQLEYMAKLLPNTSMQTYVIQALQERLERDLERLGLK